MNKWLMQFITISNVSQPRHEHKNMLVSKWTLALFALICTIWHYWHEKICPGCSYNSIWDESVHLEYSRHIIEHKPSID